MATIKTITINGVVGHNGSNLAVVDVDNAWIEITDPGNPKSNSSLKIPLKGISSITVA